MTGIAKGNTFALELQMYFPAAGLNTKLVE